MAPSPAPVRPSGYKPRKSKGGALWMVLILGIAGVGGLWVFAPDIPRRLLSMTKDDISTPSLKDQVIGTWQAEEGHTITLTAEAFTGKDGTTRPYIWQEGSIKMRKFGPADILSGNFVLDAGVMKVTSLALVGPDGNSLIIIVGDKTHKYRRAGTSGASPSVSAHQTKKPDVSKIVPAPAKEVDLSKIIALQKNQTLTELQKESQAEPLSGFITVTGKIASSMRSPIDKSRLQIFVGPSDVDHTRSIGIAAVRCDVSDFSKEVLAASPGTPIRITGQAKYEPNMMGFVIRNAKAEILNEQVSQSGSATQGSAETQPVDPLKQALEKGHAIGLEMVASEKTTKALLNEALEAERAGNMTRLRAIKAQINVLLAEKSAREKAGLEYVGGLNQSERDAYIEGIQAAQAGK